MLSGAPRAWAAHHRMAQHPLPSGRFPLKVHFDVLLRFLAVSRNGADPVTAEAVEGAGLPAGAAAENVAFLSDAGFLIEEAPGKFKPTGVAMQFLNTVAGDEQRGRKLLRSIVAKLWFGRLAAPVAGSAGAPAASDLHAALARESGISGEDGGAIAVLLEYLAFTGMMPPPTAVGTPQPPQPRVEEKRGSARRLSRAEDAAEGAVPRAGEWKEIRTEDFEVKVRSTPVAIRRLRKHLDLIEEEIRDNSH